MSQPEILAPAGGINQLKSAVAAGADAVYLGADEFSARRNAENFDSDGLEAAVEYCHLYGVRVYLTLNIAVYDRELDRVAELIRHCAQCGVDAIIVSDRGVALLAREICPEMPLHASTQLTVMSSGGVKAAKKLGFCRVVLARELSRTEIKKIHAAVPDTALEVFCHGALCMCVSGQCYFSALLGGRSGNRGLCAGTCRLPFAVSHSDNGYCLSLCDLSLLDRMSELCDTGVASLKIEGRMKRPEYVYSAVSAAVAARSGKLYDKKSLSEIFSRQGFTDGYFTGNISREMFGHRTHEDVINSLYIQKTEFSAEPEARFALDMRLKAVSGEHSVLTVCSRGETVSVTGDTVQTAQNRPLTHKSARAQLEKLGATPYFPGNIETEISQEAFMTVSTLNSLRRNAVDELNKKLLSRCKKQTSCVNAAELSDEKSERDRVPEIVISAESLQQLSDGMISAAGLIILPTDECMGALGRVPPEKLCANPGRAFFADREYRQRKALGELSRAGVKKIFVENLAAEQLSDDLGLSPVCGVHMNIFNSLALKSLEGCGYIMAELSQEITLSDMKHIRSRIPIGAVIYMYSSLMETRNCPNKNGSGCGGCGGISETVDRKKTHFRLRCRDGVTELYNSVPTYIGDLTDKLRQLDFVSFHFTFEAPDECRRVFCAYTDGKGNPFSEFTRGLYLKGVL